MLTLSTFLYLKNTHSFWYFLLVLTDFSMYLKRNKYRRTAMFIGNKRSISTNNV